MRKLLEIIGMGGDIIKARQARKIAKIDAETKITMRAADSDDAALQLASNRAASSLLDEYWTLVLSLPLILCFFPGAAEHVAAGFDNLDDTPEWFQWAVLASISFAFGRKVAPSLSFTRRR